MTTQSTVVKEASTLISMQDLKTIWNGPETLGIHFAADGKTLAPTASSDHPRLCLQIASVDGVLDSGSDSFLLPIICEIVSLTLGSDHRVFRIKKGGDLKQDDLLAKTVFFNLVTSRLPVVVDSAVKSFESFNDFKGEYSRWVNEKVFGRSGFKNKPTLTDNVEVLREVSGLKPNRMGLAFDRVLSDLLDRSSSTDHFFTDFYYSHLSEFHSEKN